MALLPKMFHVERCTVAPLRTIAQSHNRNCAQSHNETTRCTVTNCFTWNTKNVLTIFNTTFF